MISDFNRNGLVIRERNLTASYGVSQRSALFASGMVNGYFDSEVPMEFWRLLVLYISSNTLSSMPRAIPFGQSEIDTMLKQAKEVLEWFDYLRNPVPIWYQM